MSDAGQLKSLSVGGMGPAGTTDQAMHLLHSLFGDPGGIGLLGAGGGPLDTIIKTFNVAILGLAVLWSGWNYISVTVSAAHDGVFLGRKTNNAWYPIRQITGFGLLIPAFKGWNLAQLVMVWAMAVGVQVANVGYSGALGEIAATAAPVNYPPPSLTDATTAADAVFAAALCAVDDKNAKAELERSGVDLGEIGPGPTGAGPSFSSLATKLSVRFGDCGGADLAFAASDQLDSEVARALREAQSNSFQSMVAKLWSIALAAAGEPDAAGGYTMLRLDPALREQVSNAAADYQRETEVAWTATLSSHNPELKAAGSWLSAGFRGLGIARTSLAIQGTPAKTTAVAAAPTVTSDDHRGFLEKTADFFATAGTKAWEFTKSVGEGAWSAVTNPSEIYERVMTKIAAGLVGSGGSNFVSQIGGASGSAGLVALGNKEIAVAELGTVVWAGIAALVGLAQGSGVAVIDALNPMVNAIFGALMVEGMMLASWLPFIPAIMWVFGVVGYVFICVESIFAAPLWALMHLEPEGEGMGEQTAHGYIFLLNLLFRPLIMTGVMILCFIVYEWALAFGNSSIESALKASLASGSPWQTINMALGSIAVYITLATSLAVVIFQQPQAAADRVFTWIGGQFGSDVNPVGTPATSPAGGAINTARAAQPGARARDFSRAGGSEPPPPKDPPPKPEKE